MKKVIGKIWDVIKTILVVAMIAITASLLVMKIMGDTPSIMGYNLYYIATPSMEPSLEVGDIILSKEVKDYTELKEHDVITYQGEVGSYAGKLITHEIIQVNVHDDGSITFLTKGTKPSAQVDPEIRADQVRTKMICEIPFLGDIMNIINHPVGFLIIIVVPLGITFIGEIVNLKNVIKNDEEEEVSGDEKTN